MSHAFFVNNDHKFCPSNDDTLLYLKTFSHMQESSFLIKLIHKNELSFFFMKKKNQNTHRS